MTDFFAFFTVLSQGCVVRGFSSSWLIVIGGGLNFSWDSYLIYLSYLCDCGQKFYSFMQIFGTSDALNCAVVCVNLSAFAVFL